MYINRASASDWDHETTDTTLNAGSWYRWYGTMTSGTKLSGFFETSVATEGIDFLICDDTNYDLYSAGQSANVYSLKQNMHYASYSFTLPYDDDWYVVFSNRDGSSSVTVDMALDRDGDNSPYFSSLIWDDVVNGEVLENDQWYYFSLTCVEGTTIDVSFKTWFSSDGVDGFICDSENYNLWSIGQLASVWNKKDDMHIASLTTFVTPHDDTWYVVLSAVGETDTITISAGVDFTVPYITTTTTATTTTATSTTTTTATTTTTSQESDITTTTTTTTSSDAPELTSVEFIVAPIALTSLALILIRRKKNKN